MVVYRNPIRVQVRSRQWILCGGLEALAPLLMGPIGQHVVVEKLKDLVSRSTSTRHDERVVPIQLRHAVETYGEFACLTQECAREEPRQGLGHPLLNVVLGSMQRG